MGTLSLPAAGMFTAPVSVGANARVTVTGGYVQWTTASRADILNGNVTWETWPLGASAGASDTRREMRIRGVSTGAMTLTWADGYGDPGRDDEYWEAAVPQWITDANGNPIAQRGPRGEVLGGAVDVRAFSPLVVGLDWTSAIQAAIDYVAANGGGTVHVPVGIHRVSQVVLKTGVTLRGVRRENGWARLLAYTQGSIIRALDGSGLSPVRVQSPATNWGIEDLLIDANKAAQTHPGVHCIEHRRTSATGSPGGLIKGVKCVNPTGFGAYIVSAHPLEISESFFMSGLFLGRCFDANVHGCSIDGTDSKHPSLWLANTSHCQFNGNLIWRGESPSQTVSQTFTVDTVADTITVTDGDAWYDGQPVTLTTSGTYPEMGPGVHRGSDTYLVKKLGGNVLELWWANDNTTNGAKVEFATTGTGTQTINSGSTDIIHVTRGAHNRISGGRVAGSPGGALRLALSSYCQYTDVDHWALNWDNSATQPAVRLTGAQHNIIALGMLGDSQPAAGLTLVREAVLIEDDASAPHGVASVSEANILDGNQFNGTQGVFVRDNSTAVYERRNLIVGWEGLFGQSSNRIVSPQYRREAGRHYYSAVTTTASVPNATNTTLSWSPVTKGDPSGIGSGTTLAIAASANSVLNVQGKVGFSNRQAGAHYVLVLVSVGGVSHRFLWEQDSNTNKPTYVVIPFDVTHVVSATSDTSVSVTVFQNSGAALTVATGTDYTQLCISKIADYLA